MFQRFLCGRSEYVHRDRDRSSLACDRARNPLRESQSVEVRPHSVETDASCTLCMGEFEFIRQIHFSWNLTETTNKGRRDELQFLSWPRHQMKLAKMSGFSSGSVRSILSLQPSRVSENGLTASPTSPNLQPRWAEVAPFRRWPAALVIGTHPKRYICVTRARR